MNPIPTQPFDVLARDLDLRRNLLIEASAGTGKTFAIEHLFVRYLIEKPEASIEQLVVVTFTRKATRQMRQRVRLNIESAIAALSAPTQERFPYLAAIVERGETAIARARAQLLDALENFDRARISTIHTFCHQLLHRDAIGAGCSSCRPSEPHSSERDAAKGRIERRVRHWLLCQMREFDLDEEAFESLFSALCKQPINWNEGVLIAQLVKIASNRELIASAPSWNSRLEEMRQNIDEVDRARLRAQLADDPIPFKNLSSDDLLRCRRAIAALDGASADSATLADFEALFKKCSSQNLRATELKKPAVVASLKVWDVLQREFKGALQTAASHKTAFSQLAQSCQRALLPQISASDFDLDHDRVVQWVADRARDPSFCATARSATRAFIVDEFQDTDPMQWEAFRQLFLDPASDTRVVLVGDPKQSIYSFRGADVYTYQRAKELLGQCQTLDTNFRSQQSLVEGLNELFGQALVGHWLQLPKLNQPLIVRPASVHRKDQSPTKRVHFLPKLEKEGDLIELVADEIAALRHSSPTASIAAIVDTNDSGDRMRERLADRGIPVATASRMSKNSPARTYLLSCLRMVLDIGESTLHRALLEPPIGWTDRQLFELKEPGESAPPRGEERRLKDLAAVHRRRDALSATLERKGLAAFICELMNSCWHGDETSIEERWLSQCPQYALREWLQTVEELLNVASARDLRPHELLQALENLEISESAEEANGANEGVQVLTQHASKGLEFDHVFAIAIASARKSDKLDHDPIHFNWIIEEGRAGERRRIERDLQSGEQRKLNQREAEAEKARQLYVTLTRAKEHLYLPQPLKRNSHVGISALEWFLARVDQPHDDPDVLRERIEAEDFAPFETWLERCDRDDASTIGIWRPSPPASPDRALNRENSNGTDLIATPAYSPHRPLYLRTSFSAWSKQRRVEQSPEEHARREEGGVDGDLPLSGGELEFAASSSEMGRSWYELPRGPQVGDALHLILERIVEDRALLTSDGRSAFDQLTDAVGRSLRSFPLQEMMREVFSASISCGSKRFCLAQVSPRHCSAELEFLMPEELSAMDAAYRGTHWNGYIDLLFEFDGVYYLLDWKSNFIGSEDEAYHPQALAEHVERCGYPAQAELYVEALRRYLALNDPKAQFGGFIFFFLRPRRCHFIPESAFAEPLGFLRSNSRS